VGRVEGGTVVMVFSKQLLQSHNQFPSHGGEIGHTQSLILLSFISVVSDMQYGDPIVPADRDVDSVGEDYRSQGSFLIVSLLGQLREKFLIKEHILCCNQFQFPWREIPVFPGKVIKGGGLKKIQ